MGCVRPAHLSFATVGRCYLSEAAFDSGNGTDDKIPSLLNTLHMGYRFEPGANSRYGRGSTLNRHRLRNDRGGLQICPTFRYTSEPIGELLSEEILPTLFIRDDPRGRS